MRSEPRRILHVLTRYRRGGSERNLVHTMEWERDAGHDVHLAFGRDSDPDEALEGFTLHRLPHLRRSVHLLSDLAAVSDLRNLIQRVRFDLVHTHQSKAGILGRLATGRGRRVVHTVHMSSFGLGYNAIASAGYRLAERFCAKRTDLIVTVGAELRQQYLAAGVGRPRQYRIIHSPIDIDRFVRSRDLEPDRRRQIRQSFDLPVDRPIVAAVGALEPRKRVELLLTGLAPLLRSGGAVLAVAGAGPERERLIATATRLGVAADVRWLGALPNVEELLATSNVFVHAGRAEGVSQVVVQALAAGLPVVATQAAGLREVDGANVVVAPWDGDGLIDLVAGVLTKPPPPAPAASFDPWRTDIVDRGLAQLHEALWP